MLKNRSILILLLLLIVGIFAISSVSANDIETTDDVVAIEDEAVEDIQSSLDETTLSDENNNELLSSEDDSTLSLDNSNEEILESPTHDEYNVYISDQTIHNWQKESVRMYINPNTGSSYAYDFYFTVYDSDNNEILYKNFYSYNLDTYVDYTFSAYQLNPGTYTMVIENYQDDYIFDYATLTVTDEPFYATISAGNYNTNYYSGATYSIKVTERGTGSALSGVSLKIVFSKAGSTVTRYYTTDSAGMVKFTPPIGVGTYTITISSNNPNVQAATIKKTATVKKSSVTMKAAKAVTYKGFKLTLKATVKSHGKNVNEGTVKFKINGKTYSAAVKNGVATKKIKLKKIKKYKYTATFSAKNFNTKKVKAKAAVKKRYNTKVTVKKKAIKGYWQKDKTVTFKVTTKSGKKISGGYLHVYDKTNGYNYYISVKHGKAKFIFSYTGNYYYSGYQSYYFTKKAVTKYKITYEPSTHKYKGSHIKFKKTSIYKCPACGKKKTHTHGSGWGTYYYYVN